MEQHDLTYRIIGCAIQVHDRLGPGCLEAVYQNALAHELRRASVAVEREQRIEVRYDGVPVGVYVADLVVDGVVIVETNAVRSLAPAHHVQLVHYLTATGVEIGLLLNFGAEGWSSTGRTEATGRGRGRPSPIDASPGRR